ncbi:hypothetical protein CLU79DRAFT_681147, partial [Phycomyces nitens]
PIFNPIKKFWKAVKDRVKGGKLTDVETFSLRVSKCSENTLDRHFNFIQHSINVYPKYLNKEPL